MNASALTPRERLRLKAATRTLVERCGGPVEAAGYCRVAASLLSRYGSEAAEHATTFMPADVAAELELSAGEPLVSRILADIAGHDLVARKAPQAGADYAAHDTELTRSACALLVAFRERRADGSLCAADLVQLEHLSAELQRELAEFRADAARDIAGADRALGSVKPFPRRA